jgi:hypothetical protein
MIGMSFQPRQPSKLGGTGKSCGKTYSGCSDIKNISRRLSTRAETLLRHECKSGLVTLVLKNEDDLRNQIPAATAPFPVTPNQNINTTEISSSSSTLLDKTVKAIEGLANHAQSVEKAIEGLANHAQSVENRLDRLSTIAEHHSNSIQCHENTLVIHDRKLDNLDERLKQLEINGEQGTNIDKDVAARGSATPANATTNTFFGTGTTASYLETDGNLKDEVEEDAATTAMEFEIDSTLQKGQTVIYTSSQGVAEEATIVGVHSDHLLVPYYTIRLLASKREKQTDGARLSTLPTAAAASGGATAAAETPFTTPFKPPAPASASIRSAPFASVAMAAPHSDADTKPPSMAHGAAQNVFGTPQQRVFSEAGGNAQTVAFASTAKVAETSSTTAFNSPAFSAPAPFSSGTQPFSIGASSKKEQRTFAARSEKRRQTLFASKGSKSREFFRKSNRNLSSKHCRRKVSHLRPEEGGVVDDTLPVRNLSEAFNPPSTVTVGLPFNFMP